VSSREKTEENTNLQANRIGAIFDKYPSLNISQVCSIVHIGIYVRHESINEMQSSIAPPARLQL
jgi:hypothetical protein